MIDLLSYSANNVTTSAYTTVDASLVGGCGNIVVVDTSTQLMKLAIGAAGAEVDIAIFQGNGSPVQLSVYIKPGTRVAVKAITASATSGYLALSYF